MQASSLNRRLRACAGFRHWTWWELSGLLRIYVAAIPLTALVMLGVVAFRMTWHGTDVMKFLLLEGCGLVSVAATSRIAYGQGAIVRDFLTVWVLPVAILLPPGYTMLAPIPLLVLTQWRVHRGLVYRRVFTAGALGLAYGAASLTFHALPTTFAGGAIGTGRHALTWVVAVALSEIVGWLGHHSLIVGAIKLTDPAARLADIEFNREALKADFAQVDLGILVTVVVAINAVLAVFAVPTVLLARRFMMHAQLLAKTRIDTKTGLLNAATWESEAAAEISRAVRTRSPLSVALIDIDHFKAVNDTYGHLVGDTVLRALSDTLREQLRDYDLTGRFGGEEFVVLLPQTGEADALTIAERLRADVAAMSIPADDDAGSGIRIKLTISIGVASLGDAGTELTDLLTAADAALYHAKQTGRNRIHAATAAVPLAHMIPVARQGTVSDL